MHGKPLGWKGATGVGGFCEKLLGAFPMSGRAKASWLQDGFAAAQGWAHQQWKVEKLLSTNNYAHGRKEWKKCVRNSLAVTKVSGGDRGGDGPAAGAQIPVQSGVQSKVKQLCPCSPRRSIGVQRSPCSPRRRPVLEQGMPKGGCNPSGNSPWQNLWLHGERSPQCSKLAGRTCDPVGNPAVSSWGTVPCWRDLMRTWSSTRVSPPHPCTFRILL